MTKPCLPGIGYKHRCANQACAVQRGVNGVLVFLLAVLAITESALACQICVPRPTQTLANRLLQSDKVVLAREDPRRPYHYAAVETLKRDPLVSLKDVMIGPATLNSSSR